MTPSSGPGDRYSLAGLLALYQFEPTLRDVYVEGRTDAGLVRWYLGEHRLEAAVFAVDDRVTITADQVREVDAMLDINSRGRAIALAANLQASLGDALLAATVIVDADFAHIRDERPVYACLLWTDQPAMENYSLADRPLEKLLRVSLGQAEDVGPEGVRAAIVPALMDVLAVRYVLHEVHVGCIDDVAGVCSLSPKKSGADMEELLRRSLGRLPKVERPAKLTALLDRATAARQVAMERGQEGRGHDIAPMLIAFLGLKGVTANRASLEVAMRSCFERQDLDATPLFQALVARVAA